MAGYVIHLVVASEYLRKSDEVVTDKDEFIKSTIAQVEADKDLSDLPPEQRQAINKFYQLYGTTA